MPINFDAVGRERPAVRRSWDATDAIRYALGVGAGFGDPTRELAFTTENTGGVAQQVLPTFASVLVPGRVSEDLGRFSMTKVVHGEEELRLHAPLPVTGDAVIRSRVAGVYDKRSAALVVIEADLEDGESGRRLATVRSSLFVRGEGGFGGEPAPAVPWARPDRMPDREIRCRTRPEQALLYRLNGDRNPLHSDPEFASRAGFARPVLHGLCTYGFIGRALVHALAGGDATRLTEIAARFSAPVYPGDELVVRIWRDGAQNAIFQTTKSDGTVVIDHGRVGLRKEA
ncbi:MaoC/PaaZ C-terminal domain-containing protein [Saccharopolyspora shandongensis]|uniref:MaoC/PaaZ C-terminal domain-containing protein n=1 Tax=Saccharopolyspora shandongensis TaxID=418495 RepID=UPI0033D8079B